GWPAAPDAEAPSTDLDALEIPSSAVTQDYLKAIYTLGEWDQLGASASDLAARLGVGAPTVTEHVQRLAGAGLVNYQPYRRLTRRPWTSTGATRPGTRSRRLRVPGWSPRRTAWTRGSRERACAWWRSAMPTRTCCAS